MRAIDNQRLSIFKTLTDIEITSISNLLALGLISNDHILVFFLIINVTQISDHLLHYASL